MQGSHRDSIKQNKDLATLAQPASSSSNSHNNVVASKFVSTADADSSKSGPYFDVAASKNVRINNNKTPIFISFSFYNHFSLLFPQITALLGKTAYLNCRVKNLGNKTVS